jgi:predicted Fe-S protein YdhL (DUF1289 family)
VRVERGEDFGRGCNRCISEVCAWNIHEMISVYVKTVASRNS